MISEYVGRACRKVHECFESTNKKCSYSETELGPAAELSSGDGKQMVRTVKIEVLIIVSIYININPWINSTKSWNNIIP